MPTTCLGASPGSCSHLPGSLPAGLRPESGPSHLGPETAAADPDRGLRTLCGRPPQGLSGGPRPHPHRCVRTCASIPPLSVPSSGATSGQAGGPCSGPVPRGPGGQCRGCPETGGVSHRRQSWLGKVPAGLLDTATQAGPLTCGTCGWSVSRGPRPEAHAALDMGVKGASPRAESCPAQHGQRCAPCRARTLSHVPTSALSTLPVGPTLCGAPGTPATLPWLATHRLSSPCHQPSLHGSRAGARRPVGQLQPLGLDPGPGHSAWCPLELLAAWTEFRPATGVHTQPGAAQSGLQTVLCAMDSGRKHVSCKRAMT